MPSSMHTPTHRPSLPPALRATLALAAGGALALLAGCETVSLNNPAPIVVLHPASAPASAPTAPPPAPAPAASAAPAAQSQGLQPAPGVEVQPLAPASAASLPALPGASAPAGMASAAASAPAAPAPFMAGSAPASAPGQPASAPAAAVPAGAVRYVCNDGTSFLASFGDVSVTMSTALGLITLDQTVAADGARYSNGQLQVWFKGRQATITRAQNPNSEVLCLEQR